MPLHITKVEDHEGHGRCGQCGREGLRWIAILSDGTSCGTECAQRVLGRTLNPKSLTWIAGTTVIAEHTTKWDTAIVYQAPGGRTLLAINGYLQTNGGGLQQFERLYGTDR